MAGEDPHDIDRNVTRIGGPSEHDLLPNLEVKPVHRSFTDDTSCALALERCDVLRGEMPIRPDLLDPFGVDAYVRKLVPGLVIDTSKPQPSIHFLNMRHLL